MSTLEGRRPEGSLQPEIQLTAEQEQLYQLLASSSDVESLHTLVKLVDQSIS